VQNYCSRGRSNLVRGVDFVVTRISPYKRRTMVTEGSRPWFICMRCGRRVAILYLGGRSKLRFCCRSCAGLNYGSERGGTRRRRLHKARKIRALMGGNPSIVDDFPPKRAHMHWRKYERLRTEAERIEMQQLAWLDHALSSVERSIACYE
jgi:hypothetical protein